MSRPGPDAAASSRCTNSAETPSVAAQSASGATPGASPGPSPGNFQSDSDGRKAAAAEQRPLPDEQSTGAGSEHPTEGWRALTGTLRSTKGMQGMQGMLEGYVLSRQILRDAFGEDYHDAFGKHVHAEVKTEVCVCGVRNDA